VQWPEYELEEIISRITDERVCIQCLNYENVFHDVLTIITLLDNPISVSAHPFSKEQIKVLAPKIDRIAINLDCATPKLFQKVKPYYSWEDHLSKLLYARDVFGPFNVSSHIIGGLGETEQEMVHILQFLYNHQIYASLFAFTPIKGTPLEKREKPSITYYRRMQVAHYLVYEGGAHFAFDNGKIVDLDTSVPPEAFVTRGCPGCNRPYYTETPRCLFNYPYVPGSDEIEVIAAQLRVV
jgi:biotin synthase